MKKCQQKRKKLLIPNLKYCQFGQDARKTEPFSWREIHYEFLVKYLENLALQKIWCYFKWC